MFELFVYLIGAQLVASHGIAECLHPTLVHSLEIVEQFDAYDSSWLHKHHR